MRWLVESTVIATMIKAFARFYESQSMTEKTLNLRGLRYSDVLDRCLNLSYTALVEANRSIIIP